MKPIRKFQFDADFDEEAEALREEEERRAREDEEAARLAEQEAALPPPPSFDEDQMRQARQEAFEKGLEQGREEMRGAIENTANLVLDHIAIRLEGMAAEQEKQFHAAQELAVRTSAAIMKKCWPQIVQQLGLDSVERTIRQAMEYNADEMRIVVRVHDTMLDAIVQRLDRIKEQQAFAGKVIVLSDDSVIAGDCKVEWADGGMERLSRVMSSQMDRAIERILAGLSRPAATAAKQPAEADITPEQHESDTERTSS